MLAPDLRDESGMPAPARATAQPCLPADPDSGLDPVHGARAKRVAKCRSLDSLRSLGMTALSQRSSAGSSSLLMIVVDGEFVL
jgi:hypothetical protein